MGFKIQTEKKDEPNYYGNTGLSGGTKLERFLHKNQHTQRKLLDFEFWIKSKLSNVPKFDF